MKTKLCRPVLVESKEHNKLRLDNNGKLTFEPHIQGLSYSGLIHTYQQLILISLDPDEKIEVGDKYLVELFKITGESVGLQLEECRQIDNIWINNFDVVSTRHISNCKKVISTQSQLSPEYINQFIEEYNKGEVKYVEIEFEEYGTIMKDFKDINFRPKLTNGFITIVTNSDKILDTIDDTSDDGSDPIDKIEEAAKKYTEETSQRNREYGLVYSSFISGTKSEAAKEYWLEQLEPLFRECWIESFFTKRNTDITGFNEWFNKIRDK